MIFPRMPNTQVVEWIREKYSAIVGDLDERARRRWAAVEARSLGWGGIEAVAAATGMSDRTIRTGIRELDDLNSPPPTQQRRSGGGRKCRESEQPKLVEALQKLVDAGTEPYPMSPLRWTWRRPRTLADELAGQRRVRGRRQHRWADSCMSAAIACKPTARRSKASSIRIVMHNSEHVGEPVTAFQRAGQETTSVDTKKKEPLGNLKNPGRGSRRKGDPKKVKTHDFPDKKLGKAVPYGVYDLAHNEAGVSVGISHDTAEFAVAAIRRWWERLGATQIFASDAVADHGRQWGQQRPANALLEVGRSTVRQRNGPGSGTLPLSTGHERVETPSSIGSFATSAAIGEVFPWRPWRSWSS